MPGDFLQRHFREIYIVIPAQAGIQGLSVLFNMQSKTNINPNVPGFPLSRE
jgi:hypothetical protein